jgi:hypothetical protein
MSIEIKPKSSERFSDLAINDLFITKNNEDYIFLKTSNTGCKAMLRVSTGGCVDSRAEHTFGGGLDGKVQRVTVTQVEVI